MPGEPTNVRRRVLVLLPVLLALLAYAPGLRHPFVYDDHGAIVENRFLRKPSNVVAALTLRTVRDPNVLDGHRPALLVSMFLDRLGSAAPAPWRHHATNVLVHALATLLVARLVRSLGGPRAEPASVIAALLFAAHPVLSEAVQLPSYREDLLVAVFTLAFLLCARESSRRRDLAAVASLLAALASKESAAAAPLLLGWMGVTHPPRAPWRERAPLLGVALAVTALWVVVIAVGRPVQAAGSVWNGLSLKWPENLWTAPWLWVKSAGLFAWPWPLVADRVVTPVASPLDLRFLAGAAVVLAVIGLAWRLRAARPLTALGLGWAVLAWLPVSNVLPLLNPWAERYLYLAAPGVAMIAADALARMRRPSRVLAPLLAACLALVWARLPEWRSDAALWEATARCEPRSARALLGLGNERKAQGRLDEARTFYAAAYAANTNDVRSLVALAILDGQRGDLAAAERRLREAVRVRPDLAEAWENLAVALELQGRREEALEAAQRARAADLLGRDID